MTSFESICEKPAQDLTWGECAYGMLCVVLGGAWAVVKFVCRVLWGVVTFGFKALLVVFGLFLRFAYH